MNREKRIEKFIQDQIKKIKTRRPSVHDVELTYRRDKDGNFFSSLRARIKKQTVYLSQRGHSLEESLRNVFKKLNRRIEGKKSKKVVRLIFE